MTVPVPPASDPRVLSAVLESLPAHTAVLDASGRVLAVSRSWRRFCVDNGGDEASCGVGSDYLAVCDACTGEEREDALDVADGIRRVVSGAAEQFAMDYECSSEDERRWFQVSVVPLRVSGRGGERIGAVVSHTNITARKLDELELVHEATHDPLTGLLNRSLLLAELRRDLHRAHAEGSTLAVLYLDLDGFKTVNDTLGHEAGDRLLRSTADRLRAALRPGQHLARIGGDEFVALLPATGLGGARRVARRLVDVTRRPVELDGMPVVCSSSIGIAVSDAAPTSAEDLLAGADAAMYRAKRRGRARTEVFAGDLRARTRRRAEVEAQLETALDQGSLELFRQPVVSLVDGTEVGGEALVRWFTPAGGLRSAEGYLEEVTHTRVRRAITRSVLLAATMTLGEGGAVTPGSAGPLPLGVNLALVDLRGPALLEELGRALERGGCDPDRLVLEIGEPSLVQDPRTVRRAVARLREEGVRVAVDHVTGAAPASVLADLPVDGLKLDRSMVALGRPRVGALVRSLVTLTGDLGVTLTAVGVETDEQQRRLLDAGVLLGQGWRLGPPAPWARVVRDPGDSGPTEDPGRSEQGAADDDVEPPGLRGGRTGASTTDAFPTSGFAVDGIPD